VEARRKGGAKMIIAVDFDSCIAHYTGWKGVDVFGEVIAGAKEALVELKKQHHRILIYTCRCPSEKLKNYLHDNGIPFDAVNENPWTHLDDDNHEIIRKLAADVYIDDKAITFRGDWKQTMRELKGFTPWELPKQDDLRDKEE